MAGRQQLSTTRQWIRILLFPALISVLLLGSILERNPTLALAVGTLVGVILGIYGFRHTRFERTSSGMFYTPHTYFGVALALLFALSVVLRFVHFYFFAESNEEPIELVNDALTMLVFGTLSGNNVAYAVGLLRWRFSSVKAASE
jgi:ABC-type uncharacterized transport system YnjBCD permease subunit